MSNLSWTRAEVRLVWHFRKSKKRLLPLEVITVGERESESTSSVWQIDFGIYPSQPMRQVLLNEMLDVWPCFSIWRKSRLKPWPPSKKNLSRSPWISEVRQKKKILIKSYYSPSLRWVEEETMQNFLGERNKIPILSLIFSMGKSLVSILF